MTDSGLPLISVVIPIHNGEKWIDSCFESIIKQDVLNVHKLEISICNDGSTDNTLNLLKKWEKNLLEHNKLKIIISIGDSGVPRGVGYAKNKAVKQSKGTYLCFQDIDDVMMPSRISKQLEMAQKFQNSIVGCKVERIPKNSTQRLVSWANGIQHNLLSVQVYTSHGPTVLMPTWFCHRSVFDRIGGFSEEGKGVPEDLLFFYKHLDEGGGVCRVDEILLLYRYHPECTTFSIAKETIWDVRLQRLERVILSKWEKFTIWNAGKQGRRFYRSLTPVNRRKVIQFCDVDVKKTGTNYEPYPKLVDNQKLRVPIVHFTSAKPPFVICMKLNLTNGEFEKNLNSLNLVEGKDYVLFS